MRKNCIFFKFPFSDHIDVCYINWLSSLSLFIMKRTFPGYIIENCTDAGSWELLSLPSYKASPKHAVRKMTRDQLQRVMNFLIRFFLSDNDHPDTPRHMRTNLSIEDVGKKTGISKSSFFRHMEKLRTDPDFNQKSRHRDINTAMSEKLELELIMEIENNYLIPGNYFNNMILRVLAIAMWNKADPEDRHR